jgi:hypothetical protein
MFYDQVIASYGALAQRLEEDENARRLNLYFGDVANWIVNYAVGPAPKIPLAVDSRVSFQNVFSMEIFETAVPLTDKRPESFLPPHLKPSADELGIGAELKHMPGCFAFAGRGGYPADGALREKDGAKFAFVLAFYGLQGYWRKQ